MAVRRGILSQKGCLVIVSRILHFSSLIIVRCLTCQCRHRHCRRFFLSNASECDRLHLFGFISDHCKGNGRLRVAVPSATGYVVCDWRVR